jgi:lipopolysaccharide biosynthesis glycosyltransferase
MSEPIIIAAACDNHYIALLAALVKSIEINHQTGEKLIFYVIDDRISSANKTRLRQSSDQSMSEIRWVEAARIKPRGVSIPFDTSSYPSTIHLRMFIPYFVPRDLEKVIYLDVDMIVKDDISKLWKTNLEGLPVAAVTDSLIKNFGNTWGGIRNYEELGFSPDTPYFNTGMMVMNTKKWRDDDLTNKIFRCIADNQKWVKYPDQYGLNVVMAGQWKPVDQLWNWFAKKYNAEAALVHFIGRKPIFKSYSHNEQFRQEFAYYLEQTQWRGFRPVGEPARYLKKLGNVAAKVPLFVKSIFRLK